MATQMVQRSTDWVINKGHNNTPDPYGDYRYFWVIYYTTDKTNRCTKFTVQYWLQTHFTTYENMIAIYIPSGTSTVYINGSSIGSISSSSTSPDPGDNLRLRWMGEKTFTIYHNNDGSASFTFRGTGFKDSSGNTMSSGTSTYSTANGNFPKIPSQSKLGTIDAFNIDEGISSLPITQYVTSYYNVLEISDGTNVFKTIDGIANTNPVVFTEEELDNIYTIISSGTSATFTFKLTTYSGSDKTTIIGTDSKTATGNFTIVLPTVNGAVCTDRIVNMPDYTGDETNQTIIQNKSLVTVTIPTEMEAVANTRKASIVEYVIDGVHVTYNANGTSVDLSRMTKDYVTIYAVDSRGTSSLAYTQNFTNYIDYNVITINEKNWSLTRDDNGVSRFVTVSFEGNWWDGNFGARENTLTPLVYYRVNEGQIWTDLDEFVDGASIGYLDETLIDTSTNGVFKYDGPVMSSDSDKGFDIKNSYDMLIGFQDTFSNRVLTITVDYGSPAIAVYKNRAALGGPYDESLGGTQLWDNVYLNGESLESAITESGSNDLGSWIKYSDGTMITRQSYEREISGDWTDWGSLYTKPVEMENFPTAFIEPPTPMIWHESTGYLFFIAPNNTEGLTHSTSATRPSDITLIRGSSMGATTTFIVHVTAIGKWK